MENEGKLLGKKIAYPTAYAPNILVNVPRYLNRERYGIDNSGSIFCGYDVWHAYECSFLTNSGVPVVGILKLVYPSNSECIVESKSLKLYLASFNMEHLGDDSQCAITKFTDTVKRDLSALLKCSVDALFITSINTQEADALNFSDFCNNDEQTDLRIANYTEEPSLLSIEPLSGEIKWQTHLLKSNCKITGQPDWGSVYIYAKGKQVPSPKALLKYIISLRNENHFHEEICEMIFKRIYDIFSPNELCVTCLYTRRGGIDICPTRATSVAILPKALCSLNVTDKPTFRR